MQELTLAEVSRVAVLLKQCVPDLREVYIFGSAAVAALHPELAGHLRRSVDVDMAPKDKSVTPPGWQQRAVAHEIASDLIGHFLDSRDVAYNKLWVGRSKDIAYVRDILEAGIITLVELQDLHESNVIISTEDREKVAASLRIIGAP